MINSDHYRKIPDTKLLRKIGKIGKLGKHLEILEFLGKGLYAQQIVQKGMVSKGFLSKIINSFKERGLIELIQTYPKRYALTKIATLILAQGDLNQKRIPEFITSRIKSPKKLPPVRAHLDRFKNELIQKPPWLNRIRDRGIINGLTIKRVKLKNWTKFLVYFNYQDFNGLDNIEVCNNIIIYNFRQKLGDQLVSSKEELVHHNKDLILNCKQARSLLQERGFSIGQEEPVRCQKPHYGISSKDPRHIGQLGKELLMTIKTDNGSIIIDDSPGIDGEEETDDEEKVFSYLEMPDELEKVKEDVSEIKEKIDQIVDNTEDKTQKSEISELKDKISEIVEGIKEGFEKMTKALIESINPPKQEIKVETEPGGMYQ